MADWKIIGIVFSVLVVKDVALSCSLPSHTISGASSIYDLNPSSHRTLGTWKSSRGQHRSDSINKMPGTSTDSLSYPSKLGPIIETSAVSTHDYSADSKLLNDFLLLSLFSKPFITSTEPPPLPSKLYYDSAPKLPLELSDPYPTFDQIEDLQLLSILLSNSGPYLLPTPTTPIAALSTTPVPVTVSQTYVDPVSSTGPELEPIITSPGIAAFISVTESPGPSTIEPIVVAPLQPASTESNFEEKIIETTTTLINTSPAAPLHSSNI